MSDTVIRVENLSKQYRLGVVGTGSLSHDINRWWCLLRGKDDPYLTVGQANDRTKKGSSEYVWALKDVNFEVNKGEVLGVIGRNGAGKSTLLKMLSRVTAPTVGKIKAKGRIASLLEVGTGFHPELTGRENIYLNGAINGMTRAEVSTKLDEIVEFSGCERYVDTPVKRYSSGMIVRLGFAIAAHLEPEILIVDEVLAVGDADFQKKCIGKMQEVAQNSRTVIFVSHNMNAIEQLCTRVIEIGNGEIISEGSNVGEIVNNYLFGGVEKGKTKWVSSDSKYDSAWLKPYSLYASDTNGKLITSATKNSDDVYINIEGEIETSDPALTLGYAIYNEEGVLLYWSYQADMAEKEWPELTVGSFHIKSKLPKRLLNEGSYKVELIASLHFREWLIAPGGSSPFIQIQIQGGLSDSPLWTSIRPGLLAPNLQWTKSR